MNQTYREEPYCLGKIHPKCDWCPDCIADIITGSDENTKCPHYEPVKIHILDVGCRTGLQRFQKKYGSDWREGR